MSLQAYKNFLLDLFFSRVEDEQTRIKATGILTTEDGELFETLVASIEDDYNKEVIMRRFGFGDFNPHTLQALADHFERSRERMRQRIIKELDRFRFDNRLYFLATRLYKAGVTTGDHLLLVEHGADPAVIEKFQQEALKTDFERNKGLRFLLDCEGDCVPDRPCASCQAKAKLKEGGLLEVIEKLARKYYGEAHRVYELPVQVLGLSIRSKTCLHNSNIHTLGELCQHSSVELLRRPNFGRKSLNEISEALTRFGLHLRG